MRRENTTEPFYLSNDNLVYCSYHQGQKRVLAAFYIFHVFVEL